MDLNQERGDEMEHILNYFEQTVNTYLDQIAVDDGKTRRTWQELQTLAKKIGTAIAELDCERGPTAVFMEKQADVMAAFLGVLYAGSFYVYLNPEYPMEWIQKMMDVLEPSVVITEEALTERLEECDYSGQILPIETAISTEAQEHILNWIRAEQRETDYLYGMFTSGSTGTPKNVVVSHRAVCRFIKSFLTVFPITPDDVLGNQAPFDFDVSVKDIYLSIFTGAKLLLIQKQMFCTPPDLIRYLQKKQVTILIWAVSALCMVSSLKGLEDEVPEKVRYVLFSGEVMPPDHLRQWQKALPDACFANLYGPTEVVCNCTYYLVKGDEPEKKILPIGTAFPGREVFLLGADNRKITKAETPGELCVGGGVLAEGYYRDMLSTNCAFTKNPLKAGNERIYRTGDMGYYDKSGQLFFSGRRDFQIKRMGHRIELEEIELELEVIPGVDRACCLYDKAAGKLMAFYTGAMDEKQLRIELRKRLPHYMIPKRCVRLLLMPLSANGKMDRNYLMKHYGGGKGVEQ